MWCRCTLAWLWPFYTIEHGLLANFFIVLHEQNNLKEHGAFGGALVVSCPWQISITAGHWYWLHFWSQPVFVAINYFLFAWLCCAMVHADSSLSLTARLPVTSKPVWGVADIENIAPGLLSLPSLSAQSVPTSHLPWHLPDSMVNWFRESIPQKLFLIFGVILLASILLKVDFEKVTYLFVCFQLRHSYLRNKDHC